MPYHIARLPFCKRNLWLSDNHLSKHQAFLLEESAVQLKTYFSLNPAIFLPEENEVSDHDCKQVVLPIYLARKTAKISL